MKLKTIFGLGVGMIAAGVTGLGLPAAMAHPSATEGSRSATGAERVTPPGARVLPSIARLRYEGGGDWYANPSSLENLLGEIRTRTGIPVADQPNEVGPADPDLSDHPYLYATGHGNMAFTDLEVERLRNYLIEGGFLHVDDNYGLDESFRREVVRLFPDTPLAEVPLDHPVYGIYYQLPDGLPKVHEHDGGPAQAFGIFIDGRLALFYSFQSDLGDGWEDPAVHGDAPEIREQAIQMGVNLFLYALSATTEP